MNQLVATLCNRRYTEKTVAYAQSHDQSIVGAQPHCCSSRNRLLPLVHLFVLRFCDTLYVGLLPWQASLAALITCASQNPSSCFKKPAVGMRALETCVSCPCSWYRPVVVLCRRQDYCDVADGCRALRWHVYVRTGIARNRAGHGSA